MMHALEPAWEIVEREFAAACEHSSREACAHLVRDLNQLQRRFRQYQTEGDWIHILSDGAVSFARQVAIFSVQDDILHLRSHINLDLPEDLSFPLAWAGAFESVCNLKEPVTALRMNTEVTDALSSGVSGDRAHLFPITNGSRVAAVLFASDDEDSDVSALELIAGLASSVLERKSNAALHSQIAAVPLSHPAAVEETHIPEAVPQEFSSEEQNSDVGAVRNELGHVTDRHDDGSALDPAEEAPETLVAVAAAGSTQPVFAQSLPVPATRPWSLPAWADLEDPQRQLHIRAQRFARVAVAEMQLQRPEACRAGREQGDLYLFLKKEIDKARDTYRKQFMIVPSMVDYLHLELVQTGAEGDETKLGAEYPGQLY